MKYKSITFFAICLFITNCYAQRIYIHGKIVDAASSAPISKATVYINGDILISDNFGSFIYSLKENTDSFTLKVKHIGYKSLSNSYKSNNNLLYIKLEPQNYELPEVSVYSGGKKIIEKAISRIPQNYYSCDSSSTIGIQQSIERINDSDYLLVDTALLCYQFGKTFFQDKQKINLHLLQNTMHIVNNVDTTNNKKIVYFQGSYSITPRQDYIYNNLSIINVKNLDYYNCSIKKKFLFNGRANYAIELNFFKPDLNVIGPDVIIYIDSITYAFSGFITIMNEDKFKKIEGEDHTYSIAEVYYKQDKNGKWVLRNLHDEQRVIKKEKCLLTSIDFINIGDFTDLNTDSILRTKNEFQKLKKAKITDIRRDDSIISPTIMKTLLEQFNASEYFTTLPSIKEKALMSHKKEIKLL
jgi:hypothetical protein